MTTEPENKETEPTAESILAAEAAAKAAATKSSEGGPDGKPDGQVSDEVAKLLKEQMKMKERLRAAESAADERAKKLSQFEGVDPEEYRKIMDERKENERREMERKGEYDRIIKQINDENDQRINDALSQVTDLNSKLETANSRLNRLSIGNSFASSSFVQNELVLTPGKVEVLYGDHFEVTESGIVAYDKPRGATNRTPLVDGRGDSMSFEAALEKIIKSDPDFERIAKSKMKPGAKSSTTDSDKSDTKVTGQAAILAGLKALKR